jgi:hypothetical protein
MSFGQMSDKYLSTNRHTNKCLLAKCLTNIYQPIAIQPNVFGPMSLRQMSIGQMPVKTSINQMSISQCQLAKCLSNTHQPNASRPNVYWPNACEIMHQPNACRPNAAGQMFFG